MVNYSGRLVVVLACLVVLPGCPEEPDDGVRLLLTGGADALGGIDTGGADGYSVDVPVGPSWSFLCNPCASDEECGEGGICDVVSSAVGTYCIAPCDAGGSCPDGYACAVGSEPGTSACVPVAGRCDCAPESVGLPVGCQKVSAEGVCTGWQECLPDGTFSECDATVAHKESCNGKDDDCDGEADEDFLAGGLYLTFEHCGACGAGCQAAQPIEHGVLGCVVSSATGEPVCGLDHCDPGFHSPDGSICIAGEVPLCHPCEANHQCGGGLCEELGTETSCTRLCDAELPCPGGYTCKDGLCAPPSGDCGCIPQTAGMLKECSVENEHGICTGLAVCDPAQGFVDCDAPSAAAETCNGLDDDCDDEVDEDFKNGAGIYDTDEHCGGCGSSCAGAIPDATAAKCEGGACVVVQCAPGFVPAGPGACVPAFGSLCHPCEGGCGADAVCVALDAPACLSFCDPGSSASCPSGYGCKPAGSADGAVCVPDSGTCTCTPAAAGQTRPCKSTNAYGTCLGLETCDPAAGWSGCTAASPALEACNGADDDCDGLVDEGLSGVMPCSKAVAGVGECFGLLLCLGVGGLACDAPEPVPETCNQLDDDCDGAVDDGFKDPATGKYASVEHCGVCFNACTAPAHAAPHCDAAPAVPACAWTCESGFVDTDGAPGNGCECQYLGPVDLPGNGVDENCDGVDGEVAKAVFVSIAGDDSNPGTKTHPLRTLGAGVLKAKQQKLRDVYVAGGTYDESISMAPGIAIHGGYSEDFSQKVPAVHETVLTASPAFPMQGPGVVNAIDIPDLQPGQAPARLSAVTVKGPVAVEPGTSSYAVYVRDSGSGLTVDGCRIVGGKGAPGEPGDIGTHGSDGKAGSPGLGAKEAAGPCDAADGSNGGLGAVFACDGVPVSGGDGGTSICPDYNVDLPKSACPPEPLQPEAAGTAGKPGAAGQAAGGQGGYPGMDAIIHGIWDGEECITKQKNCFSCVVTLEDRDGGDGQHGVKGADGSGAPGCANALGSVAGGLFSGAAGGAGGKGSHGGGGGGGGAGGGVETHACPPDAVGTDDVGGSGGGGGSGGCAGAGGTPGTSGGGAFGIFLVWTKSTASVPTVAGNTLVSGTGGAGAAGGPGGTGGYGGPGGKGGANGSGKELLWCAPEGGYGGIGGHGGAGGGGGGGCGGPAIQIFASGKPPAALAAMKSANTFQAGGKGGAAGAGGPSKGKPGQAGQPGATQSTSF